MNNVATYQGTTKEEIIAQIIYCEEVLKNNDLEPWEAKEFNSLIKEYEEQIKLIEEAQELLDSY